MGYTASANTTTLIAKLTPYGRVQLMSNNSGLIKYFSLGDSDANYYVDNTLTTGTVPSTGGNIGANGGSSNSVAPNVKFNSNILYNTAGSKMKLVEIGSSDVTYTSITQSIIDRTVTGTGSTTTNLFSTFGLPITDTQKGIYSATSANGGYIDTALSGLNRDRVLVLAIDNSKLAEGIDGKTVKVNLTTTAATYTLYSTFEATTVANTAQDKNVSETSVTANGFPSNVSFLFSDSIKTPQGNPSKSWATGYNSSRPFSVNSKQFFQLKDSTNITGDTAVGIAYLDKGFIVVTEPAIVNSMDLSLTSTTLSATSITINQYATDVFQSIAVIASRGEFINSNNPTFSTGDVVRISEIGLHDSGGNLIAIAKPDRHITKPMNQVFSASIKINL
jgi:hypothetical protein